MEEGRAHQAAAKVAQQVGAEEVTIREFQAFFRELTASRKPPRLPTVGSGEGSGVGAGDGGSDGSGAGEAV